ncbi:MAG TPA: TPM domain-containing protein [Syntrophales bacterium]|nr:TPM domain-containing protein [Syntrophales bacterium]
MKISLKKIIAAVLLLIFIVICWKIYNRQINLIDPFTGYVVKKHHIHDEAGIISKYDIAKFDEYTNHIFDESDIDVRFVFVKNTGNETIEQLAVERMQQLGIGKENKMERGILLLYDVAEKQLRVEIGYGLEEYFPDAFIGYLVHDHVKDFFASGDITTGLRLLIRMLHHRIREQVLGNRFDPRLIDMIRNRNYLSGGAGISAYMPGKGQEGVKWHSSMQEVEQRRYVPQRSPEEVYVKYIEWLVQEKNNPRINIFTTQSQNYMAALPITKAYFNYVLMSEYGKKYKIVIKDNLALQYFTDTPLLTPHFYIRNDKGWQMDIIAEVKNTHEVVGGIYTWIYTGQKDSYTKTFVDKFVLLKNYVRIIDGDNRELPLRSSKI